MKVWRIAWGDLKRVAKDWQSVVWLVVMPLVFAFIFGSAMRSRGPQATWIPVVDLDRSELSGLFIEQVREEGYYIEVKGVEHQRELKQQWPYGVVIPADFSERLIQGQAVKLTVVKGNGSPERILEVQSRLTQAIVRFTQGLALTDVSHRTWNSATKAALKEVLSRPQLLTVTRQSDKTLRPPPAGFYQSLPGILVMFVLQMILVYGGTTLVSDRTGGRLSRLLIAPVHGFEVYLAKVLARVLLALAQSALILVGGSVLFRIPLGDHPWFLAPVVVALAAFAGSLSILAGILCRTEKQVIQIAIFAAMFLSALGGCWWPIEIVPDLFKTIAHFTPTYWGVRGLQSVMYFNKSYQVLSLECLALLGFTALLLAVAVPLARQSSRGRL